MKFQATFSIILVTIPCPAKRKDKVHLQWSICDCNPQIVLQKLGGDSGDPYKHAPVTCYDTNPLIYTQKGLIICRTKTRKDQEVSTVKVCFAKETWDIPDTVNCVWDRYGYKTS